MSGALERFEDIRAEHQNGLRAGDARFVIATNAPPSPALLKKIAADDWPDDVELHWPGGPEPSDNCLPRPTDNVAGMAEYCSDLAISEEHTSELQSLMRISS